MGTATRSSKAATTVGDLDTDWRRIALGLGASPERIEILRHQPHQALLLPAEPHNVLQALTEFDATFPARDARAVALERSAGTAIHAALEQLRDLRADRQILLLADGTGTTREHRGRERTVVAITRRLAAIRLAPLPTGAILRETDRLDRELAACGGRLSGEHRSAITLACGTRPLVVIEGQAGTGKTTTLTAITRAHQACGQQILVTSTAALAAQRLASDLSDHGVGCEAYSTAALHAAITHGRVALDTHTTIIHDEAALASTREQLGLLEAVQTANARVIAVGDPRQNQPVGASGLWTHIEHTTRTAGAHAELTRNQRAHDPADRRDQTLFRHGYAERAIRNYAARDRIHLRPTSQPAEDQALDAAHTDRTNGKTTIVIAQTSNDHLDALNARAQAIRHQTGQLGTDSLPIPRRPYQLHQGDHIQIRHTITHPDHGPLRNGTPAHITAVHPHAGTLELQLTDGTTLGLDQHQTAAADLRLAYVQHPFPAQGQTTDTTHLIIDQHATREGSYVGLTRARQTTHIYAANTPDPGPEHDRLQQLADHMSRTEPDAPSIHTPLAHETTIAIAEHTTIDTSRAIEHREVAHDPGADPSSESRTPRTDAEPRRDAYAVPEPATSRQNATAGPRQTLPTWPKVRDREPLSLAKDEPDHSPGFEL